VSDTFGLKDSGARQEFSSGMVRDTTEGKTNFLNVRFGPMFRRWAEHLTKGRQKYPDVAPGTPNWTLANGIEEYLRAKESAARHFESWLAGERDEDHAAGVYFNINLAEYILEQTEIDPATGAAPVSGGCEECEDGGERIVIAPRNTVITTAPGATHGRVIEFTPLEGGCPDTQFVFQEKVTRKCRIPGKHEGDHVFYT
jgi:hypothetical protein